MGRARVVIGIARELAAAPRTARHGVQPLRGRDLIGAIAIRVGDLRKVAIICRRSRYVPPLSVSPRAVRNTVVGQPPRL